jgi:hypothetical protein
MTALFRARRRAEEFASAVDGRSAGVPADLRELVSVATALREQDHYEPVLPRAEFAADLRSRLMAEAEHSLVPGAPLVLPTRQRGPRERRLVAAASALVILGGSAGMAVAAQGALPGEALYPIKRGIEQAEAGLSVSTAGRGQDLLRQADGRLAEVEGLLDGSQTAAPQVPGTLEDFIDQAQEGTDLLLSSFEESRDPADVLAVREFTARSIEMLQQLARTAPADAQDELAAAALTLSEIDQRAAALCGSCGADLPDLQVPDIFLAAAEVDRTLLLLEGHRLDNSHPVVADRRLLEQVKDSLPQVEDSTEDGGTTSGDGGQDAPSAPEETAGSLLDLPQETDVRKSDKKLRDTVDGTVGQLTDGLSGVVETVLPDPGLDQ